MDTESSVRTFLEDFDGAAVAYSGGVDSTVLLSIVAKIFPERHAGVFVDSPLISRRQRDTALRVASSIGANLIVVRLEWDDIPLVISNDGERCYHCKRAIYGMVREVADDLGLTVCLDGENADDDHGGRPGRRAAEEFSILSPFCDQMISRNEIVSYLDGLGLSDVIVKDTCLATRIQTGTSLSDGNLGCVEDLESLVRGTTGVRQLRIRLRGDSVTVLTSPAETRLLMDREDELRALFFDRGLGMEIDPDGYRG